MQSGIDVSYMALENMERCLFIFDDMWDANPEWWRTWIPAPTRENGFKIVIISRFRSVCKEMAVDKEINLAPLSDSEAWDLFVTKTGDHVLDPEIQNIAKEILKECEGFPIIVVTVARAMRDCTDATAWRNTLNSLQTQEIQGTCTNDIFSLLRFCYYHLKSEQIRKCFLYCGLFPEDYKFTSQELVGYWIAEDNIHNSGDIIAEIDEGKEILRELVNANMLGMCMKGGTEFFKLHDLIRDVAVSIMHEKENNTLAQAGLWLTQFLLDWRHVQVKKTSFIGNRIEVLRPHINFSSPSTLLLKDNPLTDVHPSIFSLIPDLQVLDISNSGIALFPASLCKLRKLRALFLQYCTHLSHIPSLEDLQELQYLNLAGTLIKEPPQGLERLVKLRSLDLSDTILLEYIHPGVMSSLANLEELHMQGSCICKINSPTAGECLKEIRHLKRLAILSLSAIGFARPS